jgi:hypothetical protein
MHRPRIAPLLALTVLAALMYSLFSPFLPSVNSQVETHRDERKGTPRPGKPEGTFLSLGEIKNQQSVSRERMLPVPSTMRSPRMPLEPWDGRRVGDPLPGETKKEPGEARRAHAKRHAPFVVLDDTVRLKLPSHFWKSPHRYQLEVMLWLFQRRRRAAELAAPPTVMPAV